MENRPTLQTLLESILGSRNVYFQPPPSVQIRYPAIIYSRSKITSMYANDGVYNNYVAYQIIVVDHDPDSEIVKKIAKLKLCRFDRHYVSDNLNHDSFTIYY